MKADLSIYVREEQQWQKSQEGIHYMIVFPVQIVGSSRQSQGHTGEDQPGWHM